MYKLNPAKYDPKKHITKHYLAILNQGYKTKIAETNKSFPIPACIKELAVPDWAVPANLTKAILETFKRQYDKPTPDKPNAKRVHFADNQGPAPKAAKTLKGTAAEKSKEKGSTLDDLLSLVSPFRGSEESD